MVAILGDFCTHGLLYSVGRLPDGATDRAAYKKPKVQKMTEITGLFEPYSLVMAITPMLRAFLLYIVMKILPSIVQ